MRYPLLSTVTRAPATGERRGRRRRNPLTRAETAGVLRAARGAAQLAATSPAGSGPGVARAFWTGKAERGFEIAAGMLGAPSRGRRLRSWRAADPLRRTRSNPATEAPPEYWDLMRQADALYSEMYRIRQRHFQPTHLGLGTWGRHLPLGEHAAARVRELTRQRSRLLARARTIKRRQERPGRGVGNPLTPTERERIGHEADRSGAAALAAFDRREYPTGHFMQGRTHGLRRAMTLADPPPLGNPRGRRNPGGLVRVRVIPSHSGLARFRAQLAERPIGSIPRQVSTPYAYAQTHVVWSWRGVPVIIAETSHRRYEVFRVEGPLGPVEAENPRRLEPAAKLETLRRIVAEHQAMRLGPEGSVDAFTASAILAVYDRLSPANQAKYLAMPVRQMAAVAWKLAGPQRNPQRRRRSRAGAHPRRPRASRTTTRTTMTRVTVRRNPPTAVCALCRLRPRAPVSTYCKACLAAIRRGPQRNPYLVRGPHADRLYRSPRAAARYARRRRPPLAVYNVSARQARRIAASDGRRLVRGNPLTAQEARTLRRASQIAGGRGRAAMLRRDHRSGYFNFGRASGLSEAITATAPRAIAARLNPPRGGVVIYDQVVELRAIKGARSAFPRERFKHRFTSRAKVIGLPDGSVLLKGPKPLWSRVEVK